MKQILRDLVAFRSYTDDECNRCIDYIHAWLKEHRVPCEILKSGEVKNLVVTMGQGGKCLILNAHIDVVQSDPKAFQMREDGDRLIGPGIFDMKGSAAVFMEILTEVDFSRFKNRVMFQFVPDEEVGGKRGTCYLAEKGYTGDFLICCEPTHLKISVEAKGALFLRVSVAGRASHGSRPWLGENAILKAMQLYDEIQKLPYLSASTNFFKCATANLTKIEGGDSINKTPDHCTLFLDCRYLPGQTLDEVKRQIEGVLQKFGARMEILSHAAPVLAPTDHPILKKLEEVSRRHYPECTLFGQDGTSDARFYSPMGIPGIEFGPAGGGQHSAEEFVDYPKLLLYKQMLKEFIVEFGKQ